MSKRLIYNDRKLTQAEAKRRFDDKAASIVKQMQDAYDLINYERRNFALKSLRNFVDTYMVGYQLDTIPSVTMYNVIDLLEKSLLSAKPVLIQLPRGSGKTTISEIAVLYMLASAKRKFCVIISHDARAASNVLKDIWRMVIDDSLFSQDFPELSKPFQLCNGSYRRRQLYNGISTGLQKTANTIVFARMVDDNGNELPTSACAITCRGITSGIRGLKFPNPTGRPDCVLIDDILDSNSASNPEQTNKLLDIIRKDICNLSSGKKLGMVMTSTPICADDLTLVIKDDINWVTIRYPAIMSYPQDMIDNPDNGMWALYFKLFDDESINNISHKKSLDYYRQNFNKMNYGALTFDNRYNVNDGHISGLQAILEKRHILGESAYLSELQLSPIKSSCQLDITPNVIINHQNNYLHLEIPDGYIYTTAAIDLNMAYGITYCIIGWTRDMTGIVIHHGIYKCHIDFKLPDTAYNQQVYNHLTKVVREIKGTGIKIDGIAIDAGGRNWQTVCDFCRNAVMLTGIRCCAFSGRSSTQFNPYIRTRLRDAIGKTVLCGDAREQIKSGSGQKYVFFDADHYKELAQRSLLAEVGAAGSLSLYKSSNVIHSDFCYQICNEKLMYVTKKSDGRDYYQWKTKEPHDYLDCVAMCYAVATLAGLGATSYTHNDMNDTRATHIRKLLAAKNKKKKIKIV